MTRERLLELDQAKGIGIFLVVLGHLVARTPPAGVQWYPILHERIYLFHMPFFMFVSGAIAGYSWRPVDSLQKYRSFVARRAGRLLPAYVVFAVAVFLGKVLAQSVNAAVDNPVPNLWSLVGIFLWPTESVAGYLWFVYALFLLYALTPVLVGLSGGSVWPLLLFAAGLQFITRTPYLGIGSVCEYLFVFLLGFLSMTEKVGNATPYTSLAQHLDKWWLAWMVIFLSGLTITEPRVFGDIFNFGTHENFRPYKIVFGLLSIPALLGLAKASSTSSARVLLVLGRYTFAIYLMNTMAIGFTKAVLLRIAPWDGVMFLLYAPVLLVAGIGLPIVAKKYLFKHVQYLDRITN